MQLRTVCD